MNTVPPLNLGGYVSITQLFNDMYLYCIYLF